MGIFTTNNLLNVEEVAEVFGVSQSTIRSWVYYKKIPHIKFDVSKKSTVRFNPVILNQWIEKKEKKEIFTENNILLSECKRDKDKPIKKFNNFLEERVDNE